MSAQPEQTADKENEESPVLQQFRLYAEELDDKHDRYERIVKLSRDITIESKRIIFLLHTVDKEDKKVKVLKDADRRLKALCSNHFKSIAKELQNQDPYLYLKAYTSGLQEFVEALTFYQYIENGTLKHWKDIQSLFTYNKSSLTNFEFAKHVKVTKHDVKEKDLENMGCAEEENGVTAVAFLPPTDYILGLGDLTGEVMRKCIASLGCGDTDACFTACKFVQEMNKGFISIMQNGIHKELSRKAYTLRQSVLKAETVCYNIKVRGGESSTWGLIESGNAAIENNEDEGFF